MNSFRSKQFSEKSIFVTSDTPSRTSSKIAQQQVGDQWLLLFLQSILSTPFSVSLLSVAKFSEFFHPWDGFPTLKLIMADTLRLLLWDREIDWRRFAGNPVFVIWTAKKTAINWQPGNVTRLNLHNFRNFKFAFRTASFGCSGEAPKRHLQKKWTMNFVT